MNTLRQNGMIFRILLFVFIANLFAASSVQAQSSPELTEAGRYPRWKTDGGIFGPDKSIGASCLAFRSDGALVTACEKYPDVIVIPPDGPPKRHRLSGDVAKESWGGVDIEAASILNDQLYLMDEDKLVIYHTAAQVPRKVDVLTVFPIGKINPESVNGNHTDLSSIEGLVVTDVFIGPSSIKVPNSYEGPFFYMLDERDRERDSYTAKLYVGILENLKVQILGDAIDFNLGGPADADKAYRCSELFLHSGALYALKTRRGDYWVTRLDLEAGVLINVAQFTKSLTAFEGIDTNFEGASVSSDGRVFLTADNENFPTGGLGAPQQKRQAGRGNTPLLTFELSDKK